MPLEKFPRATPGLFRGGTVVYRHPLFVGKAVLAYAPLRLLGQSQRTSLLVALGTAQIGEFSFVLAGLGRQLHVLTLETYNLILAAAMISIALNPFLIRLVPDLPPVKRTKIESNAVEPAST